MDLTNKGRKALISGGSVRLGYGAYRFGADPDAAEKALAVGLEAVDVGVDSFFQSRDCTPRCEWECRVAQF